MTIDEKTGYGIPGRLRMEKKNDTQGNTMENIRKTGFRLRHGASGEGPAWQLYVWLVLGECWDSLFRICDCAKECGRKAINLRINEFMMQAYNIAAGKS